MTVTSSINLQQTCAAVTSGGPSVFPHHPLTCTEGDLGYEDGGVMSCPHAKTSERDPRTQAAVVHSIAVLLIECASEL
jgi:hypothetical protein